MTDPKVTSLVTAEIERRFAGIVASGESWNAERTLLRTMIDNVPDFLFIKDRNSRFVVANAAAAAGVGKTPDELIGKDDFELLPRGIAERVYADDQQVIRTGEPLFDIEGTLVDNAGKERHFLTTKLPLRDERGNVVGVVGVARDVTERRAAEAEVRFLAHHDPLTRLPNRALLVERLGQTIGHASRNDDCVAVAFIDLDNFKLINDSLGHNVGDELLRQVGRRMQDALRQTDTVARIGGDEFVLLLTGQCRVPDSITTIVEKVRDAVSRPIEIDGRTLHITCSLGLAKFPEDGDNPDELLKRADAAMYRAKSAGGDGFRYYTVGLNEEAHEHLALREEMRVALARGEFELAYQPQVNIGSGNVVAVEALLRWNSPTRGAVPPSDFIPIAEGSGFIVQLGDWVLRKACQQNQLWREAGLPQVRVSVNVSARQFHEPNWVRSVKAALADTGLPPEFLELELTESILMSDVAASVATFRELQAVGVRFAIDDFGTGYSSLSALRQFPVSRLKIDRSFVRNLPDDPEDCGIAGAVISLGHKLQLNVVAEGVETAEQLAFLTKSQCDDIQGFFFGRPTHPDQIAALLQRTVQAVAGGLCDSAPLRNSP